MTLLAAFLLPAWLGIALVGACQGFGRSFSRLSLGAILALPLGIALVSSVAFCWLVMLRPNLGLAGEIALEALFALALSLVWWRRRLRPQAEWLPLASRSPLLLVGLGTASLTVGLWRFARSWLAVTSHRPGGDWDAVAIWNLKARFLYWSEGWNRAFSPEIAWSHPDYPLLLPAFIARSWVWLGTQSWLVPALTGLVSLLLLIALGAISAYRMRGWVAALVAAVLITGVAHTSLGFTQYADMPLALYFLVANVLLLESAVQPQARGLLVLAGFSAGAAVWTKNEGWVMLAALLVSEAVMAWRTRLPWVELRRRALAFAWGLLPLAGTTLLFKLTLAPANDLVSGAVWSGVLDPGRLWTILRAVARAAYVYGPFRLPLAALLFGIVLVCGVGVPDAWRAAATSLAIRLALVAAAYCLAFSLTPYPLEWHLSTTLERLFSHLFPSTVVLAVLLTDFPRQHLARGV